MFDWFRTLNDRIVSFSRTFIAIFLGDLTDSVKSVKLTEALGQHSNYSDDEEAYEIDILADSLGEEEDERYKTEVDLTRL